MSASQVETTGDETTTSTCHIIDHEGGTKTALTREEVDRRLAHGEFFWIDLHRPQPEDFEILQEGFGFHELAIEDAKSFHQRPKIDDYDDFVFLVVYGAAPDDDRLVEVHCFYSERYLVTVHRDDCPAFVDVRHRLHRQGKLERPPIVLYRIVDALVDSFLPILSDMDDHIDQLEESIFIRANDQQLQEIFQLKRLLVGMRKAVTPQRDMFATLAAGSQDLPGFTPDDDRYFRDVYDHLIRISDMIDAYRDLLTGAMDVYLSTVSNRLNEVMKQLAVIATIFLPLAWLTGFFGQNFGFEVNHISGWSSFVLLGLGTEVLAVIGMLVYFKRRGWF
jgi:magnesium transporter